MIPLEPAAGIEPATSALQKLRSTNLSYTGKNALGRSVLSTLDRSPELGGREGSDFDGPTSRRPNGERTLPTFLENL
jgi:hypothetical protein